MYGYLLTADQFSQAAWKSIEAWGVSNNEKVRNKYIIFIMVYIALFWESYIFNQLERK